MTDLCSACAAIYNPRGSSIVCLRRPSSLSTADTYDRVKSDDGPLFLGDGSLAAVPTPKLMQKGIRPVIKVVDDKCL